ncbi:MAG: nitroreductase family protein [Chloroflexota bacterium]|nr:nitroreductase family protein [Chloroflexota bacterium]
MDTYKTIVSKRDTRSFLDKSLPEDTLRRILQAGRMAGSSKNVQPCRFIVVDDLQVKEAIAKCGDFAAWIPTAPLVIAIAVSAQSTRGEYDAGRASQNMMVAGWAEGISSCPVSMHHADCARAAVGVPEDFHISIVLAFGYPAKAQKRVPAAARLPFDDYVRRNHW